MGDIFLSYAREDRDRVTAIKAALADLQLSVFVDVEGGVQAGDSFPQVIADRVVAAKAVLACWTPHALTRAWCRRECLLALEGHKLVPVAVAPLTPGDLKEFIDVSFEDLTDFTGQNQHFGWSQTLRALSRAIDAWAERHPDQAEGAFSLSARIKHAAVRARPHSELASEVVSPRLELWARLKTSTDVKRLERFAESFPGTVEAFAARELIAAINDYDALKEQFDGKTFPGLPKLDFYERLNEAAGRAEAAIVELDRLFSLPDALATAEPGGDDLDYLTRQHKLSERFYEQRNIIQSYQFRWSTYRDALASFLERWRVHPETPEIMARLAAIDEAELRLNPGITRVLKLMEQRDDVLNAAREENRRREREENERALEAVKRDQAERHREALEDHSRQEKVRRQAAEALEREERRNGGVVFVTFVSTALMTACMLLGARGEAGFTNLLLGGALFFGLGSFIAAQMLYSVTHAILGEQNKVVFLVLSLAGAGWISWSLLQN